MHLFRVDYLNHIRGDQINDWTTWKSQSLDRLRKMPQIWSSKFFSFRGEGHWFLFLFVNLHVWPTSDLLPWPFLYYRTTAAVQHACICFLAQRPSGTYLGKVIPNNPLHKAQWAAVCHGCPLLYRRISAHYISTTCWFQWRLIGAWRFLTPQSDMLISGSIDHSVGLLRISSQLHSSILTPAPPPWKKVLAWVHVGSHCHVGQFCFSDKWLVVIALVWPVGEVLKFQPYYKDPSKIGLRASPKAANLDENYVPPTLPLQKHTLLTSNFAVQKPIAKKALLLECCFPSTPLPALHFWGPEPA